MLVSVLVLGRSLLRFVVTSPLDIGRWISAFAEHSRGVKRAKVLGHFAFRSARQPVFFLGLPATRGSAAQPEQATGTTLNTNVPSLRYL